MKRAVAQEHGMGCAVACVAFSLGLSYKKAMNLFSKPQQAWGKGFNCKEIAEAFIHAGKHYAYERLKESNKKILKNANIIVYIGHCDRYPFGHYLAKYKQSMWMNPWLNCPVIKPVKSGFQKRLPGKPLYVIFPKEDKDSAED